MKRLLSTLLLLLLGFCSISIVALPKQLKMFESVKPLQWVDVDHETGEETLNIHCTTWSVDKRGYWVSAGHCVWNDAQDGVQARDYYIDGQPASPIALDLTHDLSMLKGTPAPALHLARDDMRVGDAVMIPGHPFGETSPSVWFGGVSNLLNDDGYVSFDALACGGNSGGPILNAWGQVVSVLQVGYRNFEHCSVYSGGVPQDILKQFVKRYLPR